MPVKLTVSGKDKRISKHLVSYDFGLFDFIEKELIGLAKNIKKTLKDAINKDNRFAFNDVNLRIKKLAYELLPFKIFYYVVYCVQGTRNPNRCRFCTRFFVDDVDISSYIDYKFRFKKLDFKITRVEFFMETLKSDIYFLNLYYVV